MGGVARWVLTKQAVLSATDYPGRVGSTAITWHLHVSGRFVASEHRLPKTLVRAGLVCFELDMRIP